MLERSDARRRVVQPRSLPSGRYLGSTRRDLLKWLGPIAWLPALASVSSLLGCGGGGGGEEDLEIRVETLRNEVDAIQAESTLIGGDLNRLQAASTQLDTLLKALSTRADQRDSHGLALDAALQSAQNNEGDAQIASAIRTEAEALRTLAQQDQQDVSGTIAAFTDVRRPAAAQASSTPAPSGNQPRQQLLQICQLIVALLILLANLINNLNALTAAKAVVHALIAQLESLLNAITARMTAQIQALEARRAVLVQRAANANAITRPTYDLAILAIDAAILALNATLALLTAPIRARIAALQALNALIDAGINNLRPRIAAAQAQLSALQGNNCLTGA